jgi:tetratricopeptide (TPR) repeat protein
MHVAPPRARLVTVALTMLAAILLGLPAAIPAQVTNHQHYEKPKETPPPAPSGALAPRLQNLGTHTFPVTTSSEQAQRFISQGVNLAYGFNHAEAARAFDEAARLDPDCAMAYWGHALVLGPNINAPMNPEDEPKALALVQKAVSLKSKATPREQAYIDALAARYTGKAEDRAAADRAYADAMRALHKAYPDDLDAATMFAEALMDLRPWNYWTRDDKPSPGTEEVVATLQYVMDRKGDHPGALHYWIHLWEPTRTPERAEAAADRLLPLMPGAGHMVHMPGHIYQRVGRYQDVIRANELAIDADEDYITQCRAQGIYPLGYYPHNIHFLWFGATMAGQARVAIESARKTAAAIPHEAVAELPFLQGFLVVPYYALVRFGKWDELLSEPAPTHDTIFTRGVWHYARGTALIAKGQLDEAQKELDAVAAIVRDPALKDLPASFSANTALSILRIAPEVLAGEMAARRGDFDRAVLHLDRAVRYEDALIYTEPSDWHMPVRHSLGAVLLQAGRPDEAEVVYWEDLKRNPENGWALFGLGQALEAQGKSAEADAVAARLRKARASSDVELAPSRF